MTEALSKKFSFGNFVLTIFVVLIHSVDSKWFIDSENLWEGVKYTSSIFNNIITIAVPAFYILSGYLFNQNFTQASYGKKIKSRIKSLLIPYLLWGTINVIFLVIIMKIPQIAKIVNSTMSDSLVENVKTIVFGYSVLYYIRNIMIYALLAPIIFTLLKTKAGRIGSIICCILVCIVLHDEYNGLIYGLSFYLIGANIAVSKLDLSLLLKIKSFHKIILLLIALMVFSIEWLVGNYYSWYLSMIVGAVTFWILILSSRRSFKIHWVYSCAFFIYCSHFNFTYGLRRIIRHILGEKLLTICISNIAVPVIVLGVLILVSALLQKFCLPVWNVLTGFRIKGRKKLKVNPQTAS